MIKLFTSHPNSLGETYFEHLKHALIFSFHMIGGGLACLIHAIFPFLFEKTGSNMLLKMTYLFVERTPKKEDRIVKLSQTLKDKVSA